MPKNKRPVPRKPPTPPEEADEVQAQALAGLALELAEREQDDDAAAAPAATELLSKDEELSRLVRNALRKKNDEVLYGAIEHARYTDAGAYQLLRGRIEEAAGTVLLRRDGAPTMDINAFALPLFVHSEGGLKEDATFADGAAFDQLVDSFTAAGLESPQAKVVLISHAYDIDEIDAITYSHLQDMVRDAAGSMTEKKLVARPALERSIRGWAASHFGPGDKAVELRFLLGFALKRADDAFYQAPSGEAQADAYFEARMARYRDWTVQAAPLIRRCLAADPEAIALHFLYQDLFFGAKQQGLDELAMLQTIADVNAALAQGGVDAGAARAVVGPAATEDNLVLRVRLFDSGGAALGQMDKPLDLAADLQIEVDDVCDALAGLGMTRLSVCQRFDPDGQALEERPFDGR